MPAAPALRVRDVMNAPVVGVDRDDTLWTAMDRMIAARLHHLAVLEGDRVVGVIEDRDLASAWALDPLGLKNRHAGDAMNAADTLVTPDTGIVAAAREMLARGADAMVVVDGDRHPLGMVTGRDLMSALVAERAAPGTPSAGTGGESGGDTGGAATGGERGRA